MSETPKWVRGWVCLLASLASGCGDGTQAGAPADAALQQGADLTSGDGPVADAAPDLATPDLASRDLASTDLASMDLAGDLVMKGDGPPPASDMARPACGNTAKSCGAPGACADCTGAAMGTTCVATANGAACGCNSEMDCAAGRACDRTLHLCTTTCNANQACNGGCCDGATCQPGTAAGACGANGGSCASCAQRATGHLCIAANGGGGCGCASANDCPNGSACANGQCAVACAINNPCNGGCCSQAQNGTCRAGTAGNQCGGMGVCLDCTSDPKGRACLPNRLACGCITAADCPAGKACDPSGVCGASCDANQPCNGGCCNAGTCAAGTQTGACGASGSACLDCSASTLGVVCLGASCGCNSGKDCPMGSACDTTRHACTTSCGMAQPCNGGCCSTATMLCVTGTTADQCASQGRPMCLSCAQSPSGNSCTTFNNATFCGCQGAADCPAGRSCDPVTRTCTASCSANQPCNGGCCDGTTCQPGTTQAACGDNGGLCGGCGMSSLGHLCNATKGGGACGCQGPNDCQNGATCMNGICVVACSQNAPCAQGCCTAAQNGSCVAGTSAAACGSGGGLCLACGGAPSGHACLPSSQVCGCLTSADCPTGKACNPKLGQCTASCSANQPCNGGCCAAGTCAGGTAKSACGQGGASCLDCSSNASGTQCVNGGCGCGGPGDCAPGFACDVTVHLCTKSCGANQVCNGGCCAGGTCAGGAAAGACGAGGGACLDCTMTLSGHLCVASACGCNGPGDCAAGLSCDPNTHHCTTSCGANQACNGGCCDGATCRPGTTSAQCGNNGGLCASCGASSLGHLCNAATGGGSCGCASANDCPKNAACMGGECAQACAMNAPCNTGCCSNAQGGSCQPGTAGSLCGGAGMPCVDCSGSASGHACLANKLVCGCTRTADCPSGSACDLGTGTCTAKCNANQPCNGGCCAGGTCAAGVSPSGCGAGGSACLDCSGSTNGHLCLGGACGCNTAADCGAGLSCDANTHLCTKTCGQNQPCNGGCCAGGQCQSGLANGFCGANGGACFGCANDKPTCAGGVCVGTCGNLGNGPCNGGYCCQNGQCVNGLSETHCGFSGTCFACAGNFLGSRCRSNGPGEYRCGCDAPGDCPAAGGGMPGQACDTTVHSCTDNCGAMGLTGCNGGCCEGNSMTCANGLDQAACGATGGLCVSCNLKSCVQGGCQ